MHIVSELSEQDLKEFLVKYRSHKQVGSKWFPFASFLIVITLFFVVFLFVEFKLGYQSKNDHSLSESLIKYFSIYLTIIGSVILGYIVTKKVTDFDHVSNKKRDKKFDKFYNSNSTFFEPTDILINADFFGCSTSDKSIKIRWKWATEVYYTPKIIAVIVHQNPFVVLSKSCMTEEEISLVEHLIQKNFYGEIIIFSS